MLKLKKSDKKLIVTILFILLSSFGVFFILRSFDQTISYYLNPQEVIGRDLHSLRKEFGSQIKLGGRVKDISFDKNSESFIFYLSDSSGQIKVKYGGILPTLFKENEMAIAVGEFDYINSFKAKEVLAKHDENYRVAKK